MPRSNGADGRGYYDRFRHRLMFAVIDAQGRVVAFSGRALPVPPPDAGAGEGSGDAQRGPPPKYINSPETPIYTKGTHLFGLWQARHAIRQSEHAVLVEGNFDVVSLHARDIKNVVAPLGTAFTVDQAMCSLRRLRDRVVSRCSSTATAAGRKAARAAEVPCDDTPASTARKSPRCPTKTRPGRVSYA